MRNGLPPGPTAPSGVQVARWIARPTDFMNRTRRQYGDVFTLRFASVGPIIFVSDPALIKQIFTASPDVLRAGEANWPLIPILGTRGTLLLDGQEHLKRRRVILPPFHGERRRRAPAAVPRRAARALPDDVRRGREGARRGLAARRGLPAPAEDAGDHAR